MDTRQEAPRRWHRAAPMLAALSVVGTSCEYNSAGCTPASCGDFLYYLGLLWWWASLPRQVVESALTMF